IDEHPDYFTAKRLPGVLWSTGFSRSSRLKPVIPAEAGAPLLDRRDADEAAALALVGVLDDAVDLRVERVVAAATDILPGVETSTALANKNRAAGNKLAGEALDAEHLRLRVAAVARRTLSFFVSHVLPLDRVDAKFDHSLAVAVLPFGVILPVLL